MTFRNQLRSCVMFLVGLVWLAPASARRGVCDTPGPRVWQVHDAAGLIAAAAEIGPEGGSISLAPGMYEIDRPLVFESKSRVYLVGSGWSTVIKAKGSGNAIVFRGSCWSCCVRNLAIEGPREAKSGSGIVFREGEWSGICMIDYCHIHDFPDSGIRFEGDPKKPFSSNTVSNCWLTGNLGDQLYSRYNNDFYIVMNQFGAGNDRIPRSGALLDHSSAGTYAMNYHWGNRVALRMVGSNFNRIENNRMEQSRENGILIGDSRGGDACALTIITGNTIHTNSERDFGRYNAVEAYDAVDTTFCANQVFSWNSVGTKHRSAVVIGRGCRRWIVKDNILRHSTQKAIVFDPKVGHIVKDNIADNP